MMKAQVYEILDFLLYCLEIVTFVHESFPVALSHTPTHSPFDAADVLVQ